MHDCIFYNAKQSCHALDQPMFFDAELHCQNIFNSLQTMLQGPWNILEIKYAMKKSQKSKCLTVTQPKLHMMKSPGPTSFYV
jgi:predicted secreted protein